MKYHAFLSTGRNNRDGLPEEKEFKASTLERLREFIEVYWLGTSIPEDRWDQMINDGWDLVYYGVGTINIEIED